MPCTAWMWESRAGRWSDERLMNAEIIAVGSEMLTPSRVDTNSLYLTRE